MCNCQMGRVQSRRALAGGSSTVVVDVWMDGWLSRLAVGRGRNTEAVTGQS